MKKLITIIKSILNAFAEVDYKNPTGCEVQLHYKEASND